MARQTISLGVIANDGAGDTLRQAGQKINENFAELFLQLGADSDVISVTARFDGDDVLFEGTSVDGIVTRLRPVNPTVNRVVLIPDATGTLVLDSDTQTLTNKTLTAPVLTLPQINDVDSSHKYTIVGGALSTDTNVNLPAMSDSDTLVMSDLTQTLTNKTLTTPSISDPQITGDIRDAANAVALGITSAGSAVNYVEVQNQAAGTSPKVVAEGDDSDLSLILSGKGTGTVRAEKTLSFSKETLSSNGAISLTWPITEFNSGGALAMTLADGNIDGQVKRLLNVNTGAVTITPTTYPQGTSFTLASLGYTEVVWSTTGSGGWYVKGDDAYITITP